MPRFQFQLPDIKSVAKFMGFYGAGVVTAGFFLSGPGEYAGSMQAQHPPAAHEQRQAEPQRQAAAATPAAVDGAAEPAQAEPAPAEARVPDPDRQVRTIPIVPPARASTDGFGGERRAATRDVASDDDEETAPAGCNVSACRAQYRSFDARTCTYRSYEGTTKRCTR